ADAQLGAGRVLLDGVAFRIGRWWQPPRPNDLARAGAVRLAGAADAVRRVVAQPLDVAGRDALAQLAHVLAGDGDPAHLAGPVGLLLGRGVGLTPVGDDVLAGMLVTLRALAHPAADRLAGRVRAAAPRATTVVSAALLHHAARGECVPQLASLLNAIAHGGRIDRPLDALLQVGRTSGAGLAWGVAAALDTSARSADDTAVGSHDDLATPSHPVADGPPRGRIAR
ncbi:MAG TPA: DUF2877 domain-containing protein, partial [Cryptosporangiaceae bacterium]|nr:DUF2877 domain-containing protein [Cryptosporangiaceae bacterium]